MIRYSLLTLAVVFVMGYAWRDWYRSLCAVILFMAIEGRPDMPRSMLGISGLNPLNLMLVNVVLAWAVSRRREGLRFDMPLHIRLLLLCYLAVVLVAAVRCLADPVNLVGITQGQMLNDYVINTLKWVVPGLLLFDGCNSRRRFTEGLFATLGVYVLLALQCARLILPNLDVAELERRSRKLLEQRTGYHRVEVSTMLAGASWAVFAARALVRSRLLRFAVLGASVMVVYAQALTAGRAGYASWAFVGLVLCSLRWRSYLVLAPLLAAGVVFVMPAVKSRALKGISTDGVVLGEDAVDSDQLTAGRDRVWPLVIEKIGERPWLGFGRQAMRRTGIAEATREQGDPFNHPHNAYLELLLDTGFVGFLPVLVFYLVVLFHAVRLFRDSRSPVYIAAGGAAMALVLAWLGGSMGAQTLYPREGALGMWCAMMLALRASVQRRGAPAHVDQAAGRPPRLQAANVWGAVPEPNMAGRADLWQHPRGGSPNGIPELPDPRA